MTLSLGHYTPLSDAYQADVASGKINADDKQAIVITALQTLQQKLIQQEYPSLLQRLNRYFHLSTKTPMPHGIYLWGTVGAGKTYLMDLFFQNLPIKFKWRLHFHHFMREVHDNLNQLQGKADPLRIVARHFSMRARILCLDEFIVEDIADAMLLGRLLKFLFERQIVLVITSNRAPEQLYWEGLQREHFLPAIECIKTHCQIIQLANTQDYRWRSMQQAGLYFMPLDKKAQCDMQKYFDLYAHGSGKINMPLVIEQRSITTIALGLSVAWFDFAALCNPPRSQRDYLIIAQKFSVVLISNVPVMTHSDEATVCYWIEMIDIFYDNHLTLILSAAAPLTKLYSSGKQQFAFERTLSRLIEMQSIEYLQKNHPTFQSN